MVSGLRQVSPVTSPAPRPALSRRGDDAVRRSFGSWYIPPSIAGHTTHARLPALVQSDFVRILARVASLVQKTSFEGRLRLRGLAASTEGERLMRARGFHNIRRVDCRGRHFVYRATRRGARFEIALHSRDGRVGDAIGGHFTASAERRSQRATALSV